MKSTIREVTPSRTKKARVFVTLRVISWIVSVIETREVQNGPLPTAEF